MPIKIERFICSTCGKEYKSMGLASECEGGHITPEELLIVDMGDGEGKASFCGKAKMPRHIIIECERTKSIFSYRYIEEILSKKKRRQLEEDDEEEDDEEDDDDEEEEDCEEDCRSCNLKGCVGRSEPYVPIKKPSKKELTKR